MIHFYAFRYVPDKIGLIGKGKRGQFFFICTKNKQLCLRIHVMEKDCCNVSQISISPDAHYIFTFMGKTCKPAKRLHTDGHNFRKSRNASVNILWKPQNTVSVQGNIILHKSVKSTGTEFGTPQIIFPDNLIFFHRSIGNHYHQFPGFKLSQRIVDHIAYSLMNQRHRQFLCQNLHRPASLIVALVGMTDRKMCWTYNDLFSI